MNSNVFAINLHAFQLELIPLTYSKPITAYQCSVEFSVGVKNCPIFSMSHLSAVNSGKIKSKEIKNLSHLTNAQVILTERDYSFLRFTKK